MKRVPLYISILTAIILMSCGPSKEVKQKKELEKLATEVMEVHDRSMPETGKLVGMMKKIKLIIQNEKDSIRQNEYMDVLADMERADEDMMDWMHNYKEPEEYLPFDEKTAYYKEQKAAIEEVEKRTNESIEQAKKIIDANPWVNK